VAGTEPDADPGADEQAAICLIGTARPEEALAPGCAADSRHEFWLTAVPISVTGAVGFPVSPITAK
jgi:hypothetical protein